MSADLPLLSIPPGTQVVIRHAARSLDGAAEYPSGAVGVIVAGPSDTEPLYRVRFPDGGEAALRRDELSIRTQHQRDGLTLGAQPAVEDLRPFIIYSCVVGSRAYGLDSEASDTDRRGIYLPPARLHWSLAGVPEQIEDKGAEECYWELQKFLMLALKANPNVLECLYTPLVEHATPLVDELRGMRAIFLSKLIYQTYNGYVLSQFRRMEQDLRTSGAIKQKHAMHLIRLLLSGITALREGTIAGRHVPRAPAGHTARRAALGGSQRVAAGAAPRVRHRLQREQVAGAPGLRPCRRLSDRRPQKYGGRVNTAIDPRVYPIIAAQPHPLIFATISGAHLYGFPSPDSDYDLRGVHVLPLRDVLGLEERAETIEVSEVRDGLELDLVTHDAEKFFRLLLKRNGYVLEQLCSPLVVQTTPEHAELHALVPQLLTRHHAHHYLGFAETQWRLFLKEEPRRVKPLLYVFRVLLTGIHLMQTSEVEANLVTLNETFQLSYIPDLVARKLAGPEHGTLADADVAFFEQEFVRLRAALEAAHDATHLREIPSARPALNDLLVRLRLARGYIYGSTASSSQ